MMHKTFLAGSIALATSFATPVLSADALTSFNGTNGNGGFVYGYTDLTATTPLTQFDTSATSGCALNGPTTCLYSGALGPLPQASVGGSFPTVAVPSNAVLVHPGDSDSQAVYAAYVAPIANLYSYSINLQAVGRDASGVGYTVFTQVLGGVKTFGTRALLPTFGASASLTGTQLLGVGDIFGVIIDRNGNYGGDSTGVSFSISAVPEPATWMMMILGFGMVGFAMRKRAKVRTTVRYA